MEKINMKQLKEGAIGVIDGDKMIINVTSDSVHILTADLTQMTLEQAQALVDTFNVPNPKVINSQERER